MHHYRDMYHYRETITSFIETAYNTQRQKFTVGETFTFEMAESQRTAPIFFQRRPCTSSVPLFLRGCEAYVQILGGAEALP